MEETWLGKGFQNYLDFYESPKKICDLNPATGAQIITYSNFVFSFTNKKKIYAHKNKIKRSSSI